MLHLRGSCRTKCICGESPGAGLEGWSGANGDGEGSHSAGKEWNVVGTKAESVGQG